MSFAKQKLIILESVDSTNNYAMALAQKGLANHGEAVFAIEQTMGKGTRSKSWKSTTGENIILSIIAQMQWQPVSGQFQLSAAIATACFDFINKYVRNKAAVKWPNDIFIGDSKAGGILIENILKGNLWQWSVIGIGININQTQFEKDIKAVSLKQVTKKNYDVVNLATELHELVLKNIGQLQSGNFKALLKKYNDHLFCRNKPVTLKKGDEIFKTIIDEVSAGGELLTHDVIKRKFNSGEIVWVEY